ncbi:hypothetical protein AGOR_G00057730 [Albula goreensis]|uniref:Protein dopey-2 n=1 Tax=Albula goreensis TaxID=1534307 RepID=A0A8T3DTE4_9TELE|nr:hypothetical protein AGOR_G00057730 [Albula goreensis]
MQGQSSSITGEQVSRESRVTRNTSEMIRTLNVLIGSLGSEYLWDYISQHFETCLSTKACAVLPDSGGDSGVPSVPEHTNMSATPTPAPSSISELSTLIGFLLDVFPLELYCEVQTQYLPQMLVRLLRVLQGHMTTLSLDDLTQSLNTCLKILSKIQMPAAHLSPSQEPWGQGQARSPAQEVEEGRVPEDQWSLLGDGEAGDGVGDGLGFGPEGLEVWRRGGSVETLAQCVQDILTSFITRYLSFVEELEEDTGLAGQAMGPGGPGDSWGSCMPDRPALQTVECPSGDRGSRAVGQQETGEGPSAQVAQGVSEMGSQAFSAICHLLLESTSLPLYLSEQEMEALHSCMSPTTLHTGSVEDTLPPWLRSLMLCCVLEDPCVQHAAVSCVLELLRRSQALLLLLQDKGRCHDRSDHSPFCGRLQTLAIPPVTHTILTTIANSTDFYQHVAQVLWGQLDAEQRNLHVPSVELFYRLHVLAPSPSVCEDVICQELLHRDKRVRLEALQRFSALWHLTREIQTNVNTLFNRCFDRSLLVVLDGLNSQDGALSAVSQSWLVRALSLNDVVRIMEPILLLLLHPKTQRCSIQWIKQNLTVGNLQQLSCRGRSFSEDSTGSADAMATDDQSEDSLLSCISIVDREALWAELEGTPETTPPAEDRIEKKEQGEETGQRDEEEGQESEPTQLAQLCTASAGSVCPLQDLQRHSSMDQTMPPSLPRADSTLSLGSDLLSEDEEEEDEEEATAYLRLLKQEQEQREALESLFRHTLLYLQLYDPTPVLLALSTIETLLRSCPAPFLQTLYSAQIHPGSAHLRLVNSLTQRHQEAQEGRRFYGPLPPPSSSQPRHPSTLLQLLTCVLLQYLRSHFPCYLQVSVRAMGGNREVRVKSAELLALLMQQLGSEARGGATAAEIVREVLWGCRVQRYALLALCVSMYVTQKEGSGEGLGVGPGEGLLEQGGGVSEEHLINLGGGGVLGEQALQVELLKLLQVLISLEHQVWPGGGGAGAGAGQEGVSPLGRAWQAAALFQQSARSLQYVQTRPLPAQAMLVSAAARALQPRYGYALHGHWVALISASLPYLGSSLATISAPFITQICKNLDELVTQHLSESRLLAQPDTPEAENLTTSSWSLRRESIAPDYLLMLLEGLTSITHYCLLENRRSPVVPDPADLRNARDIMLDEFPRMLNSMALLWRVVQREEPQTTSNSAPTCSRNCSTSIYFRSSKILRQKVLGFLNPLTEEFGVRVMASVGIVWGSQSNICNINKNKILPVANEIHQTVVGLIKSLSALSTNTILQLIREVLKTKPPRAKREQKLSQTALPMLHFSLSLIQSVPAELLLQSATPVLCLLRESLQLPMPPHGYFLLLGILNDFVSRVPNLDSRKYSRDLQEVTQQVLEAVGMVAGSSLEQTSWFSRNLEVKAPRKDPELPSLYDPNAPADAIATVTCHSDQALSLLAEVLAPLLDVVFCSDEKEKATPLISRLLEYVFPYLRNHRAYNAAGFSASARLLSSLSEYSYTKRCWRREAFELFMDPLFFRMDPSCIAHWVSTIDHLLTYEKTMFKDLTSTQSPSLFSNQEQRALLLKRQAFAMFSGEPDQYCPYLPLIQERLTESLRVGQTPLVMSQIFLLFRVLLLRTSPQHLISLWPVMVTELIHVFVKLEKDLLEGQEVARNPNKGWGVSGTRERNGPVQGTRERSRPPLDLPQSELEMYLSACKLLDSMLCFPPERIPLFQMYRWAFVPEVDMDSYSGPGNSIMEGEQECQPHVVRVLEGLHYRYPELSGAGEHAGVEHLEFPLLTLNALSSIAQLEPFFRVLSCAPAGPTAADWPQAMASHAAQNGSSILSKLNHVCMEDFLENMDS